MNIQKQVFSGMIWSIFEQFGNKASQFIIGIILARLLSPKDFGLIGIITVFIVISDSIASGGFIQALIRKLDCEDEDFDTAFLYNFVVSVALYLILFFSASFISSFYHLEILIKLVRVMCIVIIIDSFAFVQRAKLLKEMQFKVIAKLSVVSQIFSGLIGIIGAFWGLGVWSLVIKTLLYRLLMSISLMNANKWIPKLKFSRSSFRELFGFGSKMLITQIIESTYRSLYSILIGKFFSASSLGYFTRANLFKNLLSDQMVTVVQRVTLPALSKIQDNKNKLKEGFEKLTRVIFFVSSFSLFAMIAMAGPIILFLIGSKWHESILYLQLLAASAILYPAGEINLNILQVKGRSDIILKLQIIKKILNMPLIILGIMLGIKYLIIGMIIRSVIDFFANTYYSKQYIEYSSWQQLQNSGSFMLVLFPVSVLTYTISTFATGLSVGLVLLLQVLFYFSANVLLFELLKKQEYLLIKGIVWQHVKKILDKRNG